MDNEFGLKELYDVRLKTTYPIEINGRHYEKDEVIAVFDKIMVANFSERKDMTRATGGQGNQELITWDRTREMTLNFSQGIFSKTQFGLLTNAKLIKSDGENFVPISMREELESDERNRLKLKYEAQSPIFVYDKQTGDKLEFTLINNKTLEIKSPYREAIVDYIYNYDNGYSILRVGQQMIEGYLSFEGKTRVKEDITGHTKTGVIIIPKLKLMSDLSMRLGKEGTPVAGNFSARALPVGEKGNMKVMDIFFLEDDIDSDM